VLIDLTNHQFAYCGPAEAFAGPFAAILNSRQSKTPAGSDQWIRKTIEAVDWAAHHGFGIVSSVGMITWELALFAAAQRALPVVVVVPFSADSLADGAARIASDFRLDLNRAGFLFPRLRVQQTAKELWPSRDELIVNSAYVLLPISLRPDGNLSKFLSERHSSRVETGFQIPYEPAAHHTRHEPQNWIPNDKLVDAEWPYLTHFTRTCHGPWPGEMPSSFYAELVSGGDSYPRNVMATLRRILSMRRLIGSSDHLRGGTHAVAFTEVHPRDAIGLMRWRKRFVRWSFEPYGIGIHKAWAKRHGILPVHYGEPRDFERMEDADRPYFQNRGARNDWLPEHEWRWLGDLDLNDVPPDMFCALLRTEGEAAEISASFGIQTYAICQ
jgi:hypothetical protein